MEENNLDKTIVIAVRHGECKGNREGLFRGRSNFPLNEVGISQAGDLAKEIKQFQPTKIFTSPLLRAKQTAEAIRLECGVEVEERNALNNIKLGPWEGKHKDYIAQKYSKEWQIWLEEPEKLRVTGMETLDSVQERIRNELDLLISKHVGKTIVIVSHRATLKPLIASCINIKKPYFWHIHIDTASYSILHYREKQGFVLVQLNQNRHLKEYMSEWK